VDAGRFLIELQMRAGAPADVDTLTILDASKKQREKTRFARSIPTVVTCAMTSPLSVELDTRHIHSGTPDADRAAGEVPFIR
jgi:hypothetical protein